ncbi:site-2 protease family protein [Candidatus Odyssella thessalonicensis]|uniref:site-2 protease family protein n=1 Tax=Candidatus Odyssella thessalonicensis TaxID=84647 RepID=UPI000225BAE7|nr:site-2 protease family protein [Candidatus Odyssella thessalonicensis]
MTDHLILSIASLIALILAVTTHEAAHGFVAKAFGDRTAEMMGRMTFNPISHIDLFGTIILPGILYLTNAPFLFGYAKPVPVDFSRLQPRRLGEILVAFAGPAVNFLLAFVSALLLHVNPTQQTFGNDILVKSIIINIVLAVFNLLPILPLDGGRILNGLLPRQWAMQYSQLEPYGMLILFGLIFLPNLLGINLLSSIMMPAVKTFMGVILAAAGIN